MCVLSICFHGQKINASFAGILVNTQDEYCIIYHIKGCLDCGASEEEILEAVGVTAAFGGGAAMSQAVTLFTWLLLYSSYPIPCDLCIAFSISAVNSRSS